MRPLGYSTWRSRRHELTRSISSITASCSTLPARVDTASGASRASPRPGASTCGTTSTSRSTPPSQMAELERGGGRDRDLLLMTESVFYNLASREGAAAVSRLLRLGHDVGTHAVWPAVPERDERFAAGARLAQPRAPSTCASPVDGFLNVMAEPWFTQALPLGLEPALALGVPARGARRGARVVAAADAPGDLVYPGETMGATMRSMLDTERDRRLQQLAEDRIDPGVSETVLEGGDLNHVVKVRSTVRRPQGAWSPAVHAVLLHLRAVGFDARHASSESTTRIARSSATSKMTWAWRRCPRRRRADRARSALRKLTCGGRLRTADGRRVVPPGLGAADLPPRSVPAERGPA